MAHLLLQLLIVLGVVSCTRRVLKKEDRTYDEAECNGDIIVALRSPFKAQSDTFDANIVNIFDINSPQISTTEVELPSDLPNKKRTKIRSVAIQPCTNIIYALFGDANLKEHFLGTLTNPFDINPFNIFIIAQVRIRNDEAVPSIAFNNCGELFAIHVDKRVFLIDTTTGDHAEVDQRVTNTGSNCNVNNCQRREVMGFNWDNELFYRISSSDGSGSNFMERFEIGGREVELRLIDEFGLCSELIRELTYIGNHLWLIMCAQSSTGSTRLLDTSTGKFAKILPIGANGIQVLSGGGLIGSVTGSSSSSSSSEDEDEETTLCEPPCGDCSSDDDSGAKGNLVEDIEANEANEINHVNGETEVNNANDAGDAAESNVNENNNSRDIFGMKNATTAETYGILTIIIFISIVILFVILGLIVYAIYQYILKRKEAVKIPSEAIVIEEVYE